MAWEEFRPTKIRSWHCELAWEAVAGATSFDFQYQVVGDNDGYFPADTTTGWIVMTSTTTPKIVVTSNTAVVSNMTTDTRYRIRIKANNATTSTFNSYSYPLAVRTGLFPIEVTTLQPENYVFANQTEPGQGDFTPYTNEFGVTEQKVSDRTRDGNGREISIPYPKTQRTYQYTDGTGFVRGYDQGSSTLSWDLDTYLPTSLTANDVNINMFYFYRTAPGTIKGWEAKAGTGLNNGILTRVDDGVSTDIYDAAPATGRDNNSESLTRVGENRLSWVQNANGDPRDIALEVYEGGDQTDSVARIYNVENDNISATVTTGIDVEEGQIDVSPDGKFIIANSGSTSPDGGNILVYSNTNPPVFDFNAEGAQAGQSTGIMGHADNAITIQGHACVVGRRNSNVIMIPLEGPKKGQFINLMSQIPGTAQIGHATAQLQLHEGWLIWDNKLSGGDPSGDNRYYWHKIVMILLDESCEDRSENALMRVYARSHFSGTPTGSPYNANVYASGTTDGKKVFFNSWLNTSGTNHNEMYVAEQTTLHGDEIAFNVTSTIKETSGILLTM